MREMEVRACSLVSPSQHVTLRRACSPCQRIITTFWLLVRRYNPTAFSPMNESDISGLRLRRRDMATRLADFKLRLRAECMLIEEVGLTGSWGTCRGLSLSWEPVPIHMY